MTEKITIKIITENIKTITEIITKNAGNVKKREKMDKVTKKFYEAMEDVLLQLVLDDYDRKRYRCARFKGLMPPFDILIELLDYIPADIALDALRAKSDSIKPGHETEVYLYAIKKFDTEETKRLRRQRRKIERAEGIARLGVG